jgi:hypothetical protein
MPLLFLTAAGLFIATVITIRAILRRRYALAKRMVAGAALWLVIYFGILLTVSLRSSEHVLSRHEEKRFCGFYLDCHLACSVVDVYQTKTVGNTPNQQTAQGIYYVVTVQVSSNARRATLQFYNPVAIVVDAQGRKYERALAAEAVLEAAEGRAVPFAHAVAANDSYTKILVFELPAEAENPHLRITEGHWLDHLAELFLIGDEDSLFHKKTKFRLET